VGQALANPRLGCNCTKVLVTVMDLAIQAVLPAYDLAVGETLASLSRTEKWAGISPHDKPPSRPTQAGQAG
jgi:hypothetical protein